MAATLFSDIIFDPELFLDYQEELSPEPSAFIRSGIIRQDPNINISTGNILTVPFFKPLSGSSKNYDGTDLTITGIDSGSQTAVVIGRYEMWGAQDLAAELATKDPMMSIASKTTKYWQELWQKTLIKMLGGIFSAASFSTHVNDIAIEDYVGSGTDDNLISADAIIDTIQKAIGDNFSKVVAISMHSAVYARLLKLNLITFVPLAGQSITIPTFLEKEVIVDDAHPRVAGTTSGYKYTTFLYAKGAIGEGQGDVKKAVETDRDPVLNGGTDYLINRFRRVYHMYGSSFTNTTMATISPTDAELALAANWEMVYDPKNVPVMALITNG